MMLDYMGWTEAAALVRDGISAAIQAGTVTYDLARQIAGATEVKCSEFARKIIEKMSARGTGAA